ncbi:hypothetical protein HanRHA438_Chr03g0099641 [Helianthus annuus]|nr:hypothetical protein HanRHA438_Chr03g0099641 [Helianthus annuus]
MALLAAFSSVDKTTYNSHKFRFKPSPTNHGYWKAMLQPFLVTNNLFGYVDGTIPCPSATITPVSSLRQGYRPTAKIEPELPDLGI